MAIGSVSSSTWTVQRPDATKIASDLFAKVDTKNQGYIDTAQLQSALEQVSADGKSGSSTDVSQFIKQVDADSDGKITKQELTDGVKQLTDQLDAQFDSARIARAETGAPPPPPPSADDIFSSLDTKNQGYLDKESLQAAFDENSTDTAANAEKVDELFKTLDTDGDSKITKEEFSAGIEQLGGLESAGGVAGSDTTRQAAGAPAPRPSGGASEETASTTYEAADTNEDGTVSLQELVAYQLSAAANKSAAATEAQSSLEAVMKIVTQLAETYGKFDQSIASTASTTSAISETA